MKIEYDCLTCLTKQTIRLAKRVSASEITQKQIIKYGLNKNIWTTPLMIFGTQWYILFNIIAGTSGISKEVKFAAKNFNIKGWLWWKK